MKSLSEKPISEILEMNFFIPAYQRGFRWTDQQVEDLLKDIDEFVPEEVKDSKEKTWYCLQPIVVKECDTETKKVNNLNGTWYEVIDGQQRLTAIFLIIHYANEMWVGKQKNPEFQIKYETRNKSTEFLNKLKVNEALSTVEIDDSNIDFYHISIAYQTINNWVINYKEEYKKGFDNNDFQSKFKSNSKVILYEVEKGSVEIFTRLNMGKIPLTNAELIKALFLNSSNFRYSDPEKVRMKQFAIATEWDRIEYALQNKEFWYFINKEDNILSTRIEFIFNLMENIAGKKITKDQYSTFRFLADKFKLHNEKEIKYNWKKIKELFQTLEEWFMSRERYHKVGYLISVGVPIKDLIAESGKEKRTKTQFINFLNELIDEKIICEDIGELKYGANTDLIKKILLFHNIKTMLNNEDDSSRFPFDRYKTNNWDIEHIHAIATGMPRSKQHRIDWLINSNEFIVDDNLKREIADIVKNYDERIKADNSSFEKISNKILNYFSEKENYGKPHEDVDDISNLVLLDSGTNRAYKNAVFPAKRKTIIEKEKKGTFIPICTKNVFLKYYSTEDPQMTFWDNEKDGKLYLEDLGKLYTPHQRKIENNE